MPFIQKVVGAIICLTLTVFIVLFGALPKFRRTPIGWAHKLVMSYLPNGLAKLDAILTGGVIFRSVERLANYLFYEKHPLIQGFYLALVTGGIYLFWLGAWEHLWPIHKVCVPIVCTLPYITMHLASTTDPGYITHENHAKSLALYPFDMANFYPGNECRTCHFEKPARSKHCSICKHCISRHDHHCVWINNCVGHGNTHHFLMFLFSTNLLLSYGFFLTLTIMNAVIQVNLPTGVALKNLTWMQYGNWFFYAMMIKTWCAIVCLLCGMTGILSWCFSSYHVYLIYAGYTTSESMKWSDWKDDVQFHEAYLAQTSSLSREAQPATQTQMRPYRPTSTLSADNWPKKHTKMVKRIVSQEEFDKLNHDYEWTEVKTINELDNLYDVGFWKYMKLVFRPTPVR